MGCRVVSAFACICANLGAVAASHNIRYPVLHHNRKFRTLLPLAECGHRFAGIFETIAVKAVMNRNPVERPDSRYLGKFIHDAGGEKDVGSHTARAVGASELESRFGR